MGYARMEGSLQQNYTKALAGPVQLHASSFIHATGSAAAGHAYALARIGRGYAWESTRGAA
jgi:hypothetical protein